MSFAIRDFQQQDFEVLWLIDQECFPPGIAYSKQELRLYIRQRGSFTLVAVDAKKSIIGFIVTHSGPIGHIITIDVVARRDGVGSQLLLAAEARLRDAGSRAVGLETAVDNRPALMFYERHGYKVTKTLPRYYSNGVDALVLQKPLQVTPTV